MRFLLLMAAALSVPAFATGERVMVTPVGSPLNETLCVSMTCVNEGAHDVTVSAKELKGSMQFTVKSRSGQVRLVTQASLTQEGQISSTDLVHATALIVKAIEGPADTSAPPAAKSDSKVAAKTHKKVGLKLASRR